MSTFQKLDSHRDHTEIVRAENICTKTLKEKHFEGIVVFDMYVKR